MFSVRLGVLRSPLELVKGYTDDGKEPELSGLLKAAIPDLCRRTVEGAKEILKAAAATGAALNSKFAETGTFTLAFAELPIFFAGLTSIVGPPKPNLMQAMEAEHLHAANSKDEWTTGNYGITTTPETEWLVVTNPSSRNTGPKTSQNNSSFPKQLKLPKDPCSRSTTLHCGAGPSHPRRISRPSCKRTLRNIAKATGTRQLSILFPQGS